MNAHELKALESRRAKVAAELNEVQLQRRDIKQTIQQRERDLEALDAEIQAAKQREIVVTEHAMLRYLQRAHGIDLDAIRAECLPETVRGQVETLGNGRYPIGNGLLAVVKNRTVVSIVPAS